MIELTIYIHTPYMLNTVNIFFLPCIWFSFTFCYQRLFAYYFMFLFKTLLSTNMDDTECSIVKKQNKSTLSRRMEGSPEAVFRR